MAQKCSVSELHQERLNFQPVLPSVLKKGVANVKPVLGKATKSVADFDKNKSYFRKNLRYACCKFSGR